MSITFLIVLTLTAAATIFVVLASILLVLHKGTVGRRVRRISRLNDMYAASVTEFLAADLPEIPPGSPASRAFRAYDSLLLPLRTGFDAVPRRRREMHFQALTQVVLDFGKDLTGESVDRLVYLSYMFGIVDRLLRRLTHRRWWVRAEAAMDLGTVRARRAIAPLTAAVEDSHPDVRFQAIRALLTLVGVEALRTVFRVGRELTTWNMMELSVDVLHFREDAIPYLIEGLASTDKSIVLFCIEMLAEIGFVNAVDPLSQVALKYPNTSVRAKAIEALGRLGDSRAEGLLVKNLSNAIPQLRLSSLRALARIGTPSAVPALRQRLADGPLDEKIAAARALVRAGEEGLAVLQEFSSSSGLIGAAAGQAMEEAARE